MATYGLRTSDIVALTLADIHWRAGEISISQRKIGTVLELPLTDAVGTALLQYFKKVPPQPPFRQLFLRMRAPVGTLKTAAISQVFCGWLRRSGLQIPLQGPHKGGASNGYDRHDCKISHENRLSSFIVGAHATVKPSALNSTSRF